MTIITPKKPTRTIRVLPGPWREKTEEQKMDIKNEEITLRDLFAIAIAGGLAAKDTGVRAITPYLLADRLLEERDRKPSRMEEERLRNEKGKQRAEAEQSLIARDAAAQMEKIKARLTPDERQLLSSLMANGKTELEACKIVTDGRNLESGSFAETFYKMALKRALGSC
jgi:hypothetical protein